MTKSTAAPDFELTDEEEDALFDELNEEFGNNDVA